MMTADRGSALAMGMILLSGLAALVLAAATAATTALALAGHQQSARLAFEAAEAGIERALARAAITRDSGTSGEVVWPGGAESAASFRTETRPAATSGPNPEGFSLGEGADVFGAKQFVVISRGAAESRAAAQLEQGFYLVVPAP